ncbi:hypothetical protein Pcinc_041970 [Petrolisthes cinctipes]|uniref:Aminoacyl-transfer RNA synthetases class-II family profile domain-containing protein n=1 Tax=Petrolisthes cinctipes TaxID=88211 RepID=A0AAE1BID1_PETCI|nr:hypothetical protein Pcinc_041970 [Petrolisthes cinctipes]
MTEGGMLSLSWNNHIATFAHTLASVREKEKYSDATLSCEGNFYPVHKLVLASCSEYFTRMFELMPSKHPVIVLQEVRSQEMEALLSYMYAGVVSVAQSDLPKLIKVAETLQIKGLAVPDENLCNNMKFGHTWSPTNDHTSPFPKKHHRREDNGTQTQLQTKIIDPPRRGGSGHSPQSAHRYGPQGYNTTGSNYSNSMPHRFSPYNRDNNQCKTIHRNDHRKEHIIIPRVTPKMEYKNEGKMYGQQHHHTRPDTTTVDNKYNNNHHNHRIDEKGTDPMSDEGRERVDTEDENSSEMQEMLPVSLVKVEVKEEEEDAVDIGDGMRRECSPLMSVGPPQDHPLPLLHPRLPTPPQERHLGLPGVEGVGTHSLLTRYVCVLEEKRRQQQIRIPVTLTTTHRYCSSLVQGVDSKGCTATRYRCGELRGHNAGMEVVLRGHLQYQRLGKFATLRDSLGSVQILIRDQDVELQKLLNETTFESFVEVKGLVHARPQGLENKEMATGEVEVIAEEYKVISPARKDLPFIIRDFNQPREQLRLKHRYLDLRHPRMQHNLRLRSQVAKKMRDFLQDQEGFVEITTPTLSVNTPGGAQEFVVPSRHRGKFYSLVQSPQTYKQLTMIGGFEKYFQFAICYRDEGAKPDRQPEFMQVDIEMSNVSMEDIQHLTEQLLIHSWPAHLPSLPPAPFPSITYDYAIKAYGVDKPDTRFGWKLQDVSEVVRGCGARVLEAGVSKPGHSARAFCIPQSQVHINKKVIAMWEELAQREHDLPGVSVFSVQESSVLKGPLSKKMTSSSQADLCRAFGTEKGDTIILAVGPDEKVCGLLGKLRLAGAEVLEAGGVQVRDPLLYHFLWVVDFPLFETDPNSNRILSTHHPFTLPKEEDAHYLYTDPIKARSQHYDLVMNGCEVGGGSIRVHDSTMQRHILHNILGIEESSLGFLNEALECGAPPHGGIALGYDRLIAEMCGASSIRDVIAFPKTMEGRCMMSGAPGDITEEEKKLYHISVVGDNEPTL